MKRDDYELPLLQSILELGGSVAPGEQLYDLVASKLALADEELGYDKVHAKPKWIYELQWVRQKLVDIGELEKPKRGIWKITERGRRRAQGIELEHATSSRINQRTDWVKEYCELLNRLTLSDVMDYKAALSVKVIPSLGTVDLVRHLLVRHFQRNTDVGVETVLSDVECVMFLESWDCASNRIVREMLQGFASEDGCFHWDKLLASFR